MARKLHPISRKQITKNREVIRAIATMSDYQPSNPAYSVAALLQVDATLLQAEQAEAYAQAALDHARQIRIETGHMENDLVRYAKGEIIHQYGEDSPNVQLVGLTRKSDYKQRAGRKPKAS